MNQADPSITDRLIEAAFARIAREGWLSVSIAEIADEAGVPIGEAFAVLPSKSAVLDVLLRRVEERMLADAAPDDFPLGLVPAREGNRYLGYGTGVVDDLAAAAEDETVLVKADGARNREFKAPNDDEPQVPASTDAVLAIASAHVVGRPLDEQWVHRPERVAAITGLDEGDRIEGEHVAQVLASERGGRKGVPDGARVVPVVNKVDDADDERVARDIAAGVHDRYDVPYVALTCLRDGRLVAAV